MPQASNGRCDAHDQPALALHQVLHARFAPLISDIAITRESGSSSFANSHLALLSSAVGRATLNGARSMLAHLRAQKSSGR